MKTGDGRIFIAILRDITERKKTDVIQSHLAAIVDSSSDAIIGKTLDGIVTSWNSAARSMFGYAEHEILGQHIGLLLPPEANDEEAKILARIRKGERIEHYETVRKRRNGEVFPVSVSISPIRNATGDIISASKIVRDITQRKKAEIEGRENRFRALFDTVIDGIIIINSKGLIQTVNPAAVKLFGYSPVEVQGQNIKILMPEPYAREHDGYLYNYLTTGVKKIIGIGREVTGRRKDGSTFPMELAVSEMEVDGERMFTGIVRDITQRKAFEASLHLATEQAVEASRAKSEFLASMSHELRTPLNGILGFGQLFEMDPDLPGAYRDFAGEIVRAGNHLLSLINDLIDLSRIEAGKMELSFESVPVLDAVTASLHLVNPLLEPQQIRLINRIAPDESLAVQADSVRLRQVLINLLSNAIKYNRLNGSVTVSCQPDGNFVNISIADTGTGIPAKMQSRVFNAFDRLGRETSATVGTGIGLVITRRIVEAMGGTIGFTSIENEGSTFWIRLPQSKPTHLDLSGQPTRTASIETIRTGKARRVLYIEDNPVNVRLMQHIFATKYKDIELQDAQTAELGLSLVRSEPPALILMDINLPGMSGYEALKLLKSDPKTMHIPVVALTANAMKGDMERGQEAGFDNYVTKPINVATLLNIVDDLLH